MATELKWTALQGCTVMKLLESFKFPMKVGEGKTMREFSPSFVSGMEHKLGRLRKELKDEKISPLADETGKLLFGTAAAYEHVPATDEVLAKDPDATGSHKIKDKKAVTTFSLSGDATKALFWMCWYFLSSLNEKRMSIGEQQEFLWPIIEQMKRVSIMKDELGITKDGKMGDSELELKTDEDYAASKEADKPKAEEKKPAPVAAGV